MKGKIKAILRFMDDTEALWASKSNVPSWSEKKTPVAVIDVSDEEALVEQVARALCTANGHTWFGFESVSNNGYKAIARAGLESLGILKVLKAPRKQSKRKGNE